MATFLKYFQVIVSILFILTVMVQNRGSGLSGAIAGQSGEVKSTKRGAEKVVGNVSIVLAILFVLISLVFIFVP